MMAKRRKPPPASVAPTPVVSPVAAPVSKVGLGTWDLDSNGTALRHVEGMGFGWYYNWQSKPLWYNPTNLFDARVDFAPMIWGRATVDAPVSGAALLGFNEPDNSSQANMTVEEALTLWPILAGKRLRLGSPAPTTEQAFGAGTWLNRFMAGAAAKSYRVDFIAVHYYSPNPDVGLFLDYLLQIRAAYGLPIWITEWALVDWNNPSRFSLTDTAKFASEAIAMLDTLAFVERHAWFAAYAGGDNWFINTELFDRSGVLTPVGNVFANRLGMALV